MLLLWVGGSLTLLLMELLSLVCEWLLVFFVGEDRTYLLRINDLNTFFWFII